MFDKWQEAILKDSRFHKVSDQGLKGTIRIVAPQERHDTKDSVKTGSCARKFKGYKVADGTVKDASYSRVLHGMQYPILVLEPCF